MLKNLPSSDSSSPEGLEKLLNRMSVMENSMKQIKRENNETISDVRRTLHAEITDLQRSLAAEITDLEGSLAAEMTDLQRSHKESWSELTRQVSELQHENTGIKEELQLLSSMKKGMIRKLVENCRTKCMDILNANQVPFAVAQWNKVVEDPYCIQLLRDHGLVKGFRATRYGPNTLHSEGDNTTYGITEDNLLYAAVVCSSKGEEREKLIDLYKFVFDQSDPEAQLLRDHGLVKGFRAARYGPNTLHSEGDNTTYVITEDKLLYAAVVCSSKGEEREELIDMYKFVFDQSDPEAVLFES